MDGLDPTNWPSLKKLTPMYYKYVKIALYRSTVPIHKEFSYETRLMDLTLP